MTKDIVRITKCLLPLTSISDCLTSISDCHRIENPFVDGSIKKVPPSLWRLSSLNQEQSGSVAMHESVDIKMHTWWIRTDTGRNLEGCEREGGTWSQQGMDE